MVRFWNILHMGTWDLLVDWTQGKGERKLKGDAAVSGLSQWVGCGVLNGFRWGRLGGP